MLKEFKDFIATGNVIDFAVGVIMAAAIGAVINSFVTDIAMPIIGALTGGMNFSDLKYVLSEAVIENGKEVTPENAIAYGKLITSFISLLTIGIVMFMIVKAYNKTKKPVVEVAAGPTELDLLTEIRDSLKK
ncbi:MAG: large conductance mechanosensitive channel protein MscL [Bacteroidota bacterium]